MDDRHPGEGAGVGEEEARGEVVGGVDDDGGAGDDVAHRGREGTAGDAGDHDARRAPLDGLGEGVELGAADVFGGEEDLAVEVGDIDAVVVDDREPLHAARDEGDRQRRADAARADDHHARRAEVAHRKYSSRLK